MTSVLPPKYPSTEASQQPLTAPSPPPASPTKAVHSRESIKATPLPTLRLIILGLAVLADAFSVTIVYPFAPFLVRDLMHIPEWRQNEVGYYSGLIASCFTLGSMFGSPMWGALSDQVGRRPVILIGLLGDFLFINLFGMASNIATALIFRFLHGLSSGNIAVAKTYLADITDASNESTAFGLIGLTFGVGVVIGPIIGGFLSRPSMHFPQYFPPGSFFDRFPYLLPCLLVSFYVLIDFIFAFFFLNESKKETWTSHREEEPMEYSYGIIGESFSGQEQGIGWDTSVADEVVSIAPSDYGSVREQERNYVDRNLLETFERQAGVTPRMSQSLFASVPSTISERSMDNSLRTPLLGTERSRSFLGGSPSTRSIRSRRGRERRDREWDEHSFWSSRGSYSENRGPLLTEGILELDEEDLDRRSKVLSSSQQSLSRSIEKSIPEEEEEEDENNDVDRKSIQGQNAGEEEGWFYSEEYIKNRGNASWTTQRKGSESSSYINYGISGSFGATTANILSPSLRPKIPRTVDRLKLDEEDMKSTIQESVIEEASLFSPDEEGTILPEPTNATIENKTFRLVLIVAVLISFTLLAGDEVIPVWASTQPRFGGLGFSSTDIGSLQTLSGITTILVALYFFPFIARRLGVVNTMKVGLLVGSINYLLPATIISFGWSRKDLMAWILYAVFYVFLAFFEQCCWAGISLIVKNSVHPASVGMALGLAQGLQSAGFAAGPVIGGSLFAFAISLDLPSPLSFGRCFFYLESSLLLFIFFLVGSLPRWPWRVQQVIR